MKNLIVFTYCLISIGICAPQIKSIKPTEVRIKTYKVTIFKPEKKIYNNVSQLNFQMFFDPGTNNAYSSKVIEFYEEPNKRHVIIGEGWIAEENFR